MDFDDTPEEALFRAEVKTWLSQHAKPRGDTDGPAGPSNDPDPAADARHVAACKQWQLALYEGGWAGITWPEAYGGRGGTSMQQSIFNQEQSRFDVSVGAFAVGIGMVGPTLIAWGTDEQKQAHLDATSPRR